ncbi:MAG: tetratricopeptide repeat protein [Calditrichaeota bacterium]|nr:tetratricopeptide repeat protein [Calditrichota bacterium]
MQKKSVSQKQGQISGNTQLPPDHPPLDMMRQIKELKNSLKNEPNNPELLTKMANSYFDIGNFKGAVSYYKKAVDLGGKKPETLIDLGVSYFNIGKFDSALYFVDQAVSIKPDHKLGLFNKGVIQFNLNQFQNAIETWENLIKLYPNSQEATAARGYIKQAKQLLTKS